MDANGNTRIRGGDGSTYDQANRLPTTTLSGTTTASIYDGDGKRGGRTVGTNSATIYVYDVAGGMAFMLTDGNRTTATSGPQSRPLRMRSQSHRAPAPQP